MTDWAAEGLLDGLDGDRRAARARLLDHLEADGVPLEALRTAAAEDRLVAVPLERALLALPRLTLAEVAEQAGTTPDAAAARLRSFGLSIPEEDDVRAFGDDEVAVVRRVGAYEEGGLTLDDSRQVVHVLSASMSRAAEPLRQLFTAKFLQSDDSEDELALRFGERADQLLPLAVADLEFLLRSNLRDLARHDVVTATELLSGDRSEAVDTCVAFADIVGFTALGEEIPEADLTDIAEWLERLAGEHVHRPARVVKTIGDAVMVVGREPRGVLDAMLALVDAAEADPDKPPLRAGVAFGRAVPRMGDWFGSTVNLAARLTQRARAGAVLASNPVRDALGDDADAYAFSEAGFKRMKGISDAVPALRVRRAASSSPDE